MGNDRSPMGLDDRFVGVCVSIFVGALALNWAVQLLAQIWIQLLVSVVTIALITTAILIYRWRRDRW